MVNLELPPRYKADDLERLLNERFRRIAALLPTSGSGGTSTGGSTTVVVTTPPPATGTLQLMEVLTVPLADGPGLQNISSVSDPVENALLAVDIMQSAVGGMEIAWSAQFAPGTSPDIPMLPLSRLKKLFVGKADLKWHDFSQLSA